MEIGIDIEDNKRFENLKPSFVKKVYTKNEIEHANGSANPSERFCSLWCAKEAVIKALSDKTLNPQNIEILTQSDGKPYVLVNEVIKNSLQKQNASEIKISLSHSKNYSVAMCLIY